MLFKISRMATLAVWAGILVNLLWPFESPIASILNITAIVLIIAHLTEYFLFQSTINRLPHARLRAFISTLLFGLFYWKDPAMKQH